MQNLYQARKIATTTEGAPGANAPAFLTQGRPHLLPRRATLAAVCARTPSSTCLAARATNQQRARQGRTPTIEGRKRQTAPQQTNRRRAARTIRSPKSTDATTNGTHRATEPIMTSVDGPTSATAVQRVTTAGGAGRPRPRAAATGATTRGTPTNDDARTAGGRDPPPATVTARGRRAALAPHGRRASAAAEMTTPAGGAEKAGGSAMAAAAAAQRPVGLATPSRRGAWRGRLMPGVSTKGMGAGEGGRTRPRGPRRGERGKGD